jgi:type III pantothenate kinase
MYIAIDVGNTRAKAAVFKEGQLEELTEGLRPEDLPVWVEKRKPEAAIIGSVNVDVSLLHEKLSTLCPCLLLSPELPVPLKKEYKTPGTLGADRLAAAVGGMSMFPQEAVMVIDAGTCITYDLVSRQKAYMGGAIAPGLLMRLKAMHNFTARLPLLVEAPPETPLLGQSTKESMESGVVHGMSAEIEGMIDKFKAEFGEMRIIICGGDSKFFETKIKQPIFVIPELVLLGLNEILQYNAPYK